MTFKVCPETNDGVHRFTVKKGFMVCAWCMKSQVYTENHSMFWKKVVK